MAVSIIQYCSCMALPNMFLLMMLHVALPSFLSSYILCLLISFLILSIPHTKMIYSNHWSPLHLIRSMIQRRKPLQSPNVSEYTRSCPIWHSHLFLVTWSLPKTCWPPLPIHDTSPLLLPGKISLVLFSKISLEVYWRNFAIKSFLTSAWETHSLLLSISWCGRASGSLIAFSWCIGQRMLSAALKPYQMQCSQKSWGWNCSSWKWLQGTVVCPLSFTGSAKGCIPCKTKAM